MAKTKVAFILLTCATSGIAAILSLIALGTEQWIISDARFTEQSINEVSSEVKYGLFKGVFLQRYPSRTAYEITMTCLVGDNVCALICKNTGEERKEVLKDIYKGEDVQFDFDCPSVKRLFADPHVSETGYTRIDVAHREYINAGCYFTTIVFLIISAIFGVFSTALSVWNTGGNPIEQYFNIFGLYIYNSIAAVAILIAIITWGIQYAVTIVNNDCTLNSITGKMESWSYLGYSYWINLVSLILYCASITSLYLRQYLIEREPYIKEDIEDIQDSGNIIIY